MRRVAVLSAVVLAGGLIGTSAALATADDRSAEPDARWIAVEGEFAIVLPNGETFVDDGTTEGPEGAPPVGARLFISEVVYDTDDGTTRGDEVGRNHIECTAQALPENLRCVATFVFTDGSQLHAAVLADFGAEASAEAFSLDVAVTGGTGTYAGATGVVTLTDISTAEETVTRYEADLDLPRR